MLTLTECLQIQLNEGKKVSVKMSDVIDTMREHPEYYFTCQWYLSKRAYGPSKGKKSSATVQYNKEKKLWEVNTGTSTSNYSGGFEMKDNPEIKTLDDLLDALSKCNDSDINFMKYPGFMYTGKWDENGDNYTRKLKTRCQLSVFD